MNAWTSPTLIAPLATRRPPTTATMHVLEVAQEHRGRLHQARHELRAERRLVELVVGVAEPLLDLALAAERLHDGVAGERLLDLRVERAGARPLRDEARPGPRRRSTASTQIDTGTVVSATSASSGEIVNIMIAHADEQQHRREHLAQRLLQALRDVVDVVGDPAQQVAARLLVDVAERQRVDLVLGRRRAAGTSAAARRRRGGTRSAIDEHGRRRRRARPPRRARGAARPKSMPAG